jgi:hypothetical protein
MFKIFLNFSFFYVQVDHNDHTRGQGDAEM